MSYFSARSTWMSLIDSHEPPAPHLEIAPVSPFGDEAGSWKCEKAPEGGIHGIEDDTETRMSPSQEEDEVLLKALRELRHRLFFAHGERQYGPALLENTLKLARRQRDAEEALFYYCHARFVARTLAEGGEGGGSEAYLPLLEILLVIAEIQQQQGNEDSASMYAREGLDTVKSRHFPRELDAQITHLTVRFFRILGRGA